MEQQWIKVSDRLPDYDVRVLVYEKVKPQFENISVQIGRLARTTKGKSFERHEWEDDENKFIHVIAWMPLPEPPKE